MQRAINVQVNAMPVKDRSSSAPSRRRLHYIAASFGGLAIGIAIALSQTHITPLATHRVTIPLNSGASIPPVALGGMPDIAPLLLGGHRERRWAVIGGAFLQAGIFTHSISAIERAVALDDRDTTLHVALGEAMALADQSRISDRAKAEFEIGLRADPNNLIARFYMAHWLLQNGKSKQALVKWVGLMRTVGADPVWYGRLWSVMPYAAKEVGISELALQALCTAGM